VLPGTVKQGEAFAAMIKDCAVDPRPADFVKKCTRAPAADMPKDLAQAHARSQSPAAASAGARENAAMGGLSSDLLDREKKSLGAMPFVVLNRDPSRLDPAFSPEEGAAFERLWLQLHLEIMDLSSDSQLHVVPRAGHNIQNDRPDAVIAAVTDMVWKIRRQKP
jgi:pimeloyl-ACP methyl ester carboxylesterase